MRSLIKVIIVLSLFLSNTLLQAKPVTSFSNLQYHDDNFFKFNKDRKDLFTINNTHTEKSSDVVGSSHYDSLPKLFSSNGRPSKKKWDVIGADELRTTEYAVAKTLSWSH